MEIWKTLRVSHISTPPTVTADYYLKSRYTNIPPGTRNRSGHPLTAHAEDYSAVFAFFSPIDSTAALPSFVGSVSLPALVFELLEQLVVQQVGCIKARCRNYF
jgi:hypothetical protein